MMLPLFANVSGRRVVLVGGGPVAAAKLSQLRSAGADVVVIAPSVVPEIAGSGARIVERVFAPGDLDGAWLVVAAATPDVNRAVAEAAEARRVFVNAVDDPAHASVYLGGVVRRHGVTVAVSTDGVAPAMTSLLREGIDALLPEDLGEWMAEARRQRTHWRRDRVPVDQRRPLLLEALNERYERAREPRAETPAGRDTQAGREGAASHARAGSVSIVGAGPGDPGLLTRRAVACLRAADLVLYDALVDPRVLRYARRAQRFFVGKRADRHAMSQQAIQHVMIRAARRGRYVVRLKGGDPFVFGRGGEEALALRDAGIPFELVPGVSSAVAAPGLAGVPVTHRAVASGFVVVTGHDEQRFVDSISALRPGALTLVVLMGMGRRAAIARALEARGWPAATPAAVIVDASTGRQQEWRGSLEDLAAGLDGIDAAGAGTLVVGAVAALDCRAGLRAENAPAAAPRARAGRRQP